ncbi:hypothetical protein MLD38_029688 [Melastoma candidum]|uniref:Uncharacterized protein n=1 Tax=Melastoma candidum TaxID=119954 RepID=A0ACB9N642_9MYRT|nr:hypothetical protein MLD38_029688 [Melastoma candidum]
MALTTSRITELPLRSAPRRIIFFPSSAAPVLPPHHPLRPRPLLPTGTTARCFFSSHSSPWLDSWTSCPPRTRRDSALMAGVSVRGGAEAETSFAEADTKGRNGESKGQKAIERIVLRLRNLGLGIEEDDLEVGGEDGERARGSSEFGEEKLSDLLRKEWLRPDSYLIEREVLGHDSDDDMVLPWERERGEERGGCSSEGGAKKDRTVKAPTLAELTIEDGELRRLRRDAMFLRERINVAKAGLTKEVLEKIHDKWRKAELVRLKFHEFLAKDMRIAHEIVERRTGGLVIWRSGSVMVVYRGKDYQGPASRLQSIQRDDDATFVPHISSGKKSADDAGDTVKPAIEKGEMIVGTTMRTDEMTEEEAEFNNFLDSLGPRFVDWWGTGILPVDADQLPPKVPDYKTPFRLLPTGMRSRLTNAEMTNLRKLAKSLPCHFALGRNRNHQGLACAIVKLWERSLVTTIAVKRGIQNTNNKLMAEELKMLTGGILLLRNKYFIVIYRGKDFLPPTVAAALLEREAVAKRIQDTEEKVRNRTFDASLEREQGEAPVGTLAEFFEAQARWGRDVSAEEREQMIREDSKSKNTRMMKKIEHKLALAQAKKLRAERLLSKVEASMIPSSPDDDQETITDEERVMFRRVGLRMKPYLTLGIRGVFDGVIENMHLHWKYRELVKLITKQKTLAFVEDTARLLEYESGGILVAIERLPKGFVLIYYRGKNYKRPISIRPRNLLTKAKALKRSVALQRYEALSQHISELESSIKQMKMEIGESYDSENEDTWSSSQVDANLSEDESWLAGSSDDEGGADGEDVDESDLT